MSGLFLILICIAACIGFPFFIIYIRLNASKIKGWIGEKNISNQLEKLDKDKYIPLNDILIKTENGKTSQIDHLVISVYGVFVIETKNYKGWIFGNEKSENWSQIIYSSKNYFRNPVKQNLAHIYALKYILKNFNTLKYIPIVVFTGSAVLKQVISDTPVIYDYELVNSIKKYSNEMCISFNEVQNIVSILKNANIKDRKTKKEHINTIRQTITEKQSKIESRICPRCNSELKFRNGKNGRFYGCSSYPRCKFTMPYNEK